MKKFRYGSFFLLLISIASISLNIFFFKKLTDCFVKLQYSRVFPLGFIYDSPKFTTKLQLKRHSNLPFLIMVGDSRIQMWDTSPITNEIETANIGHGGQTTAQIRFQVENSDIPRGDWMLLQAGINDLHTISAFASLNPLIINNCKTNIRSIVQRFKTSGYNIILTTLFPPSQVPFTRKLYWEPNTSRSILELNEFLRQLSKESEIYLLDAHKLLKGKGNNLKPEYTDPDFFLHVNHKAYGRLNKELLQIVKDYSRIGL